MAPRAGRKIRSRSNDFMLRIPVILPFLFLLPFIGTIGIPDVGVFSVDQPGYRYCTS